LTDDRTTGKELAAACADVREAGAGDAVAGVGPRWVASPISNEETSAVLRVANAHDLAVVPRGSGSRLGWGRPPQRCDLVLDMRHMDQVIEHTAGDLVARVQAGATMGHVAGVLTRAGQQIALDAPDGATIGGLIADGLAGPRRLRFGTPRDLLIGITIVRADGTIARSGGKVVKNVAGYDLGKLFAGSRGTLGVITEATFRLHPLPASSAWVTTRVPSGDTPTSAEVARVVAAAANSPLLASAVDIFRAAPGDPVEVAVLLEGSPEGVTTRAQSMAELLGGASGRSESPPRWWGRTGSGTPSVRVSFWVSALPAVLEAVDAAARAAGLRPVVSGAAGAGVLDVSFDGDPGEFVTALRSGLFGHRGSVTVLSPWGGDALGDVPGLQLMRAVKDQFDPGHLMAPGRITEGL
jgi:glycolate oxidase FAD binding subunit